MSGWIRLTSSQTSTNFMFSDLGREFDTLMNLKLESKKI